MARIKTEKETKIRLDIPLKIEEYQYLINKKGNRSWRKFIFDLLEFYEENNKEKAQVVV